MGSDWKEKVQRLTLSVRNFIDGQWQSQAQGNPLEKHSPRDGTLLYRLSAGTPADADRAVTSAQRAFHDGRWSHLGAQRRKDVLLRLASLLDEHREELALLECLDVGKPITDALTFDVPAAVSWLRYCAEAADKHHGKVYVANRANLSYELRKPVGIVAGIVGWNFPLFLAVQKLGPALATGNSLVLKPSEYTALSAGRLAELALEAGVPAGVFNVVNGDATVGSALAHHQGVDLLTFTGSTQTGKRLLVSSGESNMKRLLLECGGKAPNVVFDDCPDLDAVADAVAASAFWNQGQVCVASSRVLIQDNIHIELVRRLTAKISELRIGDPLNTDTKFGALISKAHQEKVLRYTEIAEREGAIRAYRGNATVPFETGFYVQPHLFDHVKPEHRIAQEEIFGPVLSVLPFRDEVQAVQIANSTIYGLSAILWTRDLGRAHRISHGIRAGSIVVNSTMHPEGAPAEGALSVGGHKQSGIGTEGGVEGLEAYTVKTAVQYFV